MAETRLERILSNLLMARLKRDDSCPASAEHHEIHALDLLRSLLPGFQPTDRDMIVDLDYQDSILSCFQKVDLDFEPEKPETLALLRNE
jgi:uncharacterized protein YehS (DUF1456 family)